MAPILAVEVVGRDEREPELREKARWYLRAGVPVVWIMLPEQREVLVVTRDSDSRRAAGAYLPPNSRLPELAPGVDELFLQVSR